MTADEVTAIASSALFLIIKVAAPLLLVSLAVGLIVSIFQTVTSIQEQTLTFCSENRRDISDAYIAWKLDINRIVRLYSNALVGF